MDTADTVKVDINDLRARCVSALQARGAAEHVAHVVFDDYLEAEARGRASHGFVAFDLALRTFPTRGAAEIVDQRASILTLDGHGDCGHWVARRGINSALPLLNESGTYTIGIRDITRFNTPGSIARYGADNGALTLVFEYGGANFIAPRGATQPVASTNPIGIAFPGTNFLLDIAVSERAWNYIMLAKLTGQTIPDTWGLDAKSASTTQPDQVTMLPPFGGHKGFGLALATEILTGALLGVPIGSKGSLSSRGALIILIKPDAFGVSTEDFTKRVTEFLAEVESTPSTTEEGITYPGARSEARYQTVLREGTIELPEPVWAKLLRETESY